MLRHSGFEVARCRLFVSIRCLAQTLNLSSPANANARPNAIKTFIYQNIWAYGTGCDGPSHPWRLLANGPKQTECYHLRMTNHEPIDNEIKLDSTEEQVQFFCFFWTGSSRARKQRKAE